MKSVGHGITTVQDLENDAEVWNLMLALSQDIGHKLRVYNKNTCGVAIHIRYVHEKQLGGKQWQCQIPVATHSAAIIAKAAYELFERNYNWEHTIRAVTVRAINLQSQDIAQQLQFFSDPFQVEKKEKLETVVEDIRRRFGKYSIQPATLYQNLKMTPNDVELRMPTGMIG